MPQGFYFMPSRDIGIWMPASFPPWMRTNFTWHDSQIVARLKPGVTLEHARMSMTALSLQVTEKDFRGPHSVVLNPLREEMTGKTQTALIVLLYASAALLLIACVNLANLLMSRAAARGREVAVRTALGAKSSQILLSFSQRGLALTLTGLVIGLGLAAMAARALTSLLYGFRPDYVPTATAVSFILSGVAVLACFVPARRASRVDPVVALRHE